MLYICMSASCHAPMDNVLARCSFWLELGVCKVVAAAVEPVAAAYGTAGGRCSLRLGRGGGKGMVAELQSVIAPDEAA